MAESDRRYYQKNKEKCCAWQRAWEERNKDKVDAFRKQYYKDNKEKILAYKKEWRRKNKKKIAAQAKKHRAKAIKENKEVYVGYARRARQKVSERAQRRKKELVEAMGGACSVCGNSFPLCAYDFHHNNKEEKEHKIAEVILMPDKKYNMIIEKEIGKCSLVCSNCHRVIHFGRDG